MCRSPYLKKFSLTLRRKWHQSTLPKANTSRPPSVVSENASEDVYDDAFEEDDAPNRPSPDDFPKSENHKDAAAAYDDDFEDDSGDAYEDEFESEDGQQKDLTVIDTLPLDRGDKSASSNIVSNKGNGVPLSSKVEEKNNLAEDHSESYSDESDDEVWACKCGFENDINDLTCVLCNSLKVDSM